MKDEDEKSLLKVWIGGEKWSFVFVNALKTHIEV